MEPTRGALKKLNVSASMPPKPAGTAMFGQSVSRYAEAVVVFVVMTLNRRRSYIDYAISARAIRSCRVGDSDEDQVGVPECDRRGLGRGIDDARRTSARRKTRCAGDRQ